MNYAKDFMEWAEGKYFLASQLKTCFTPYEQERKFEDESIYEQINDGCIIANAVQISAGDMLVGLKTYWEAVDSNTHKYFLQFSTCVDYYRLSELHLTDITATEDYDDWEKRYTDEDGEN